MSLSNLGTLLSKMGRFEQALEASHEALNIRRALAQRLPAAYQPALVRSLRNFARELDSLGRREDAIAFRREALAIVQRRVKDGPDTATLRLVTEVDAWDQLLPHLIESAEAGDGAAACALGYFYDQVYVDHVTLVDWRALAQPNQAMVARPKRRAAAIRWYKMAVALGNAQAIEKMQSDAI